MRGMSDDLDPRTDALLYAAGREGEPHRVAVDAPEGWRVTSALRRAQEVGALVLIDASQAAPHMPLDVQALQADFVAFTGHKMCGPTGIGVLWGRQELLEDLPPFLGGGEMIETVSMHSSTYAPAPHKFEAGTPPVAQAVGRALDDNWRTPEDFLRHFKPIDIMTGLEKAPDLRAPVRKHRSTGACLMASAEAIP